MAAAWAARARAHAPYSGFAVGAAVLAADGSVWAGCNVENLSYGLTMCAERVALGNAIVSGHRDFLAMVVVADTAEPISPCGACRQVLAEFGDFPVRAVNAGGLKVENLVSVWLPRASTGILDRS